MPFVTDLDRKLQSVKHYLGYRTDKQLADHLCITPANIPKWKDHVPDHHVSSLAKLVGTTDRLFVERTGEEFATWLEQRQATSHVWDQLLKRAKRECITIVRIATPQSALGYGAFRGIAMESEDRPLLPEGMESYKLNDRICLDLSIPGDHFPSHNKIYALLLSTDRSRTQLITPVTQPLLLNTKKPSMRWPEDAPRRRLTLRNPPGEHLFTAIFMNEPLYERDSDAAAEFGKQDHLTNAQLNAIADRVFAREPRDWLISTKEFYVSPH